MSASPSKPTSSLTTFEFTKRKRWADLLVHELSDAVIFVLSSDAKIWFCGRAVTEILGWSDTELIDRFFLDLLNQEDQRAFLVAFEESLRSRAEMNSYVRLKARSLIIAQSIPQSEVLFELKGYPYFLEHESAARCFFAVARPYPSRNNAMLNTILELKAENERLRKRLAELCVRSLSPSAPTSGPSTSPVYSLRSSSVSRSTAPSVSLLSPDVPSALYTPHLAHPSYDGFGAPPNQMQGSSYESFGLHTYSGQYMAASSAQLAEDDLNDDTSRRKKMKKSLNVEQYVCVTCGRTDSPEWRKGPQGPKTLCNACGLRWAKEVRSKVDENAAAGTSSTANNA